MRLAKMAMTTFFPPEARILITGAAGNLGTKLRRHWEGKHRLAPVDIDPRGDPAIQRADLSQWDDVWPGWLVGIHTVVHLAADPVAYRSWGELVAPNLDALTNLFLAAAQGGVKRIIYASSNHVMGGYANDESVPRITTELPPRPGTQYVADGQPRDSTAYGAAKLFGERLGKTLAQAHGISVIAVRLGWVYRGENRPEDLPAERGEWFRRMWLSNGDFCRLMDCCLTADPELRFAVVHGMSQNDGMKWDLTSAKALVGYEPLDGVERDAL